MHRRRCTLLARADSCGAPACRGPAADVGISNSGFIFLLGLLMSQFTLTGWVAAPAAYSLSFCVGGGLAGQQHLPMCELHLACRTLRQAMHACSHTCWNRAAAFLIPLPPPGCMAVHKPPPDARAHRSPVEAAPPCPCLNVPVPLATNRPPAPQLRCLCPHLPVPPGRPPAPQLRRLCPHLPTSPGIHLPAATIPLPSSARAPWPPPCPAATTPLPT